MDKTQDTGENNSQNDLQSLTQQVIGQLQDFLANNPLDQTSNSLTSTENQSRVQQLTQSQTLLQSLQMLLDLTKRPTEVQGNLSVEMLSGSNLSHQRTTKEEMLVSVPV
jgi:hypothetical protein